MAADGRSADDAGAGNDVRPEGEGHDAVRVRMAERRIAVAFSLATIAALGLAGVYVSGGQPQAEGALLFLSLGGVGVGLVLWGRHLLGDQEVTDERKELEATEEERDELGEAIDSDEGLGRRRFLGRLLGAAAAALGLAALFPIRSLGPSPGGRLRRTSWRPGVRLLDQDGRLVRADTVTVGGIVTVFPEGHGESADSQAVLVRVPASLQIVNQATPPSNTTPVQLTSITLVPGCGQFVISENCPAPDPGVFQLSPTGIGEADTACAGITFSIVLIDPAQGKYQFIPPPPPVVLQPPGTPGDTCRILFTLDVIRAPTLDAVPAVPGRQTVQLAAAQGINPNHLRSRGGRGHVGRHRPAGPAPDRHRPVAGRTGGHPGVRHRHPVWGRRAGAGTHRHHHLQPVRPG